MTPDIIHTLLLAGAFLAVFGLAELMYHTLKVRAEYTRKFVHVVSGLLTLLFPVYIHNPWLVLFLTGSFALILLSSLRFGMLHSINAVGRQTWGSLVYPAAVMGCYLAYYYSTNQYLYFYIPILTMALCDPVAALTGKKWGVKKYSVGKDRKSWVGSFAFFVLGFGVNIVSFILLSSYPLPSILLYAMLLSLTGAAAEAISRNGFDNITIPGFVLIVLVLIVKLA